MSNAKVKINKDLYNLKVAITEEEQHKGLSGVLSLGDNEGMIFLLKKPKDLFMVMKGMKIPLDFVFVDENWEVIKVDSAEADSNDKIESEGLVKAIIEINKGKASNYSKGDKVSIIFNDVKNIEYDKAKTLSKKIIKSFQGGGSLLTDNPDEALLVGDVIYDIDNEEMLSDEEHLFIIDDNKNPIFKLKGKERIFSIDHTKKLFDTVLKAKQGEIDKKEVGKLVVDIFNLHKSQKSEFVKK